MFTTFSSNGAAGTSSESASNPRPKRNQVARACDWCRMNRIKCDDHVPCQNCQNRGGQCTHSRSKDTQSLAAANQEIERLGSKVKELEERIKEYREREAEARPPSPATSNTPLTRSSSPTSTAISAKQIWTEVPRAKKQWKGIRAVSDPKTSCPFYFRASSATYFTEQVKQHLRQELQGSYNERDLRPNTACNTFASPTSTLEKGLRPEFGDGGLDRSISEDLSRSQEETFLNLFWQSYHCLFPIVDEAEFREHYDSLWVSETSDRLPTRRASALIDIILAICMQWGVGFMFPREDDSEAMDEIGSEDSSIAGRGFYARCQRLLEFDFESPSINTLRCLVFSFIYLRNASFRNQADNLLSTAIRIAYTLGLDVEPPEDLSPVEQDNCRRLWWTLYLFDTQMGTSLGRPFFIQTSTIQCSIPDIDPQSTAEAIPHLTLDNGEISLVDYSTHSIKLALTIRGVYAALNERSSELIQSLSVGGMHDDPKVTENLANLLSKATKSVEEWAENVPEPLRSPRKGNNEPFSAHRSTLNIDLHQPIWLQRQRVNLNLLYHEMMMCLFRPFIRIPPRDVSKTPASDGHSISCLNHAMAITSIAHQVLSETDILNGFHCTYRTQLDAAWSIFGFILGNPVCPPTPSGRKALQKAASVFDMLGTSFASAASAANVTRRMSGLAQQLIQVFRGSLSTPSSNSRPSPQSQQQTQTPPQQQSRPQTRASSSSQQQQQNTALSAFQPPMQQQNGPNIQQHQLFSQMQPSISMPGDLFSGISSFPTLLTPTLNTINGMNQWPGSMPMDISPDMLSLSDTQQLPWSDLMADVQGHESSSDQAMSARW